jgi:hypothetical protein
MKLNFSDSLELPIAYVPSEYDVICGWARQNYHHGKSQWLSLVVDKILPGRNSSDTKHRTKLNPHSFLSLSLSTFFLLDTDSQLETADFEKSLQPKSKLTWQPKRRATRGK